MTFSTTDRLAWSRLSALARALRFLIAMAVTGLVLSACMVPYKRSPGFHESRSDLTDQVVARIVIGKSTRDDVQALLPIGPDVESADGSWVYYESNYLEAESGAWVAIGMIGGGVVFPWAQNARYLLHRLLIRYDAEGLVTTVEDKSSICTGLPGFHTFGPPSDQEVLDCPLRGLDADTRRKRQEARQQSAFPDSEGPWRLFPMQSVLWKTGPLHHMLGIDNALRCGTSSMGNAGELGLSLRSLVFLPREQWRHTVGPGAKVVRIARDQIASVRMIDGLLESKLGVEIMLSDGGRVTLAVCKSSGYAHDMQANQAVFEQLGSKFP